MDDPIPGQKVSQLYSIENWQLFYGNFIRPKIKVGTEWVYKGQNAGTVEEEFSTNLSLSTQTSASTPLLLWRGRPTTGCLLGLSIFATEP